MSYYDVDTLLSEDPALRLHHRVLLGVVAQHLEGDVKLVGIVDSDDPLVGGLVLEVEVQLHREDEYGHLAVQDGGRGGGAH